MKTTRTRRMIPYETEWHHPPHTAEYFYPIYYTVPILLMMESPPPTCWRSVYYVRVGSGEREVEQQLLQSPDRVEEGWLKTLVIYYEWDEKKSPHHGIRHIMPKGPRRSASSACSGFLKQGTICAYLLHNTFYSFVDDVMSIWESSCLTHGILFDFGAIVALRIKIVPGTTLSYHQQNFNLLLIIMHSSSHPPLVINSYEVPNTPRSHHQQHSHCKFITL